MRKVWTILLIIIILMLVSEKVKQNERVRDAKQLLIWEVSADFTPSKRKDLVFNSGSADLHWVDKPSGQAVTAYQSQVLEMWDRWYNRTRILDILMSKSMECHAYHWNCIWYARDKNFKLIYPLQIVDYWPFQINKIHKEVFNNSLSYKEKEDWAGLFKYQLTYANGLIESYMNNNCKWEYAELYKLKGETTNERRAKCVYIHYNGSSNKVLYANIAWRKRVAINEWLINNSNF